MNGKVLRMISLPINVHIFFKNQIICTFKDLKDVLGPGSSLPSHPHSWHSSIFPLLFRGFLTTAVRGPRNSSGLISLIWSSLFPWESSFVTNRFQCFHSSAVLCYLWSVYGQSFLFHHSRTPVHHCESSCPLSTDGTLPLDDPALDELPHFCSDSFQSFVCPNLSKKDW